MNPTPPLHEPPQRNTTFKGDVLRLVSGTGLAQLIGVLAAPILTRLYAPEAFGVAANLLGDQSVLCGIDRVVDCPHHRVRRAFRQTIQ